MSKFSGETERNLARVLKTAEMKKSVLLFEELLPQVGHIGFRFFEALHFAMVG